MDLSKLLAVASEAKDRIAANSGNYDKPVKPPNGVTRWRILPGWRANDPETFFRPFGAHFIKVDGKVVGSFVCEAITSLDPEGHECQFCDALNIARRETKDDDALKKLGDFRAGTSYLVNALKVDGDGASLTQPKLTALPQGVMNAYLGFLKEYQEKEGVLILDPTKGHNIIITREGTNFNTKYSVATALSPSAVDPAALASLVDIDAYIQTETTRGKPNQAKFAPALIACARSLGLPTLKLPSSLIGGTTLGATTFSAPGLAAPAGTPSPAAVASAATSAGRTINAEEGLPWAGEATTVAAAPVVAAPVAEAPAPAPAPASPPPSATATLSDSDMEDLLRKLSGG